MVLLCLAALSTLTVGDGQTYSRIEEAVATATAGETIEVFAKQAGYGKTAVRISIPGLHIVGISSGRKRIVLDGAGFDYSGSGSVPRAIFQIDPSADGVTIENFDMSGAHNASFNGAGVRINQASRATIRNCDIHANDMGIMSSGVEGNITAASDQFVDRCVIHENGAFGDPGYNHNLYLGGTSATVQFCDIYGALTGHNLKSRAHFNLIQYCYIHGASNREVDLVESWDTTRPDSNAVLIGNVVVKDPNSMGNRTTIHFGQESGLRIGTIFLIDNTIVTPFASPVLALSTPKGAARFFDDVVFNNQQNAPSLVGVSNGATLSTVAGRNNWIDPAYTIQGTTIDPGTRFVKNLLDGNPKFGTNYALADQTGLQAIPATYVDGNGATRSGLPKFRFVGDGVWVPYKLAARGTAGFVGAG